MFVIFLTQIAQISQIFFKLYKTRMPKVSRTEAALSPKGRDADSGGESEVAMPQAARRLRRLFFYLTQISQITRIFFLTTD